MRKARATTRAFSIAVFHSYCSISMAITSPRSSRSAMNFFFVFDMGTVISTCSTGSPSCRCRMPAFAWGSHFQFGKIFFSNSVIVFLFSLQIIGDDCHHCSGAQPEDRISGKNSSTRAYWALRSNKLYLAPPTGIEPVTDPPLPTLSRTAGQRSTIELRRKPEALASVACYYPITYSILSTTVEYNSRALSASRSLIS